MLLVGAPRPGTWPIRLPIQMNTNDAAEQRQELPALAGPMVLSSCATKKLMMSSRTIWSLPGFSTLSFERMARPSTRTMRQMSAQKTR